MRTARTYNQNHKVRPETPGRRRVSVYTAWTYPGEVNADPRKMDNRFSTMTEVRRVLWPAYEAPQWADPKLFNQGIAGSLELFYWAWVQFQDVVEEVTGHAVPMFQRVDQAGFQLPLDERVLADADTLLVFGLDHMVTEQTAAPEEIDALRAWLEREGTCLVIGPHHDVGHSDDLKERAMEYVHHGDPLVPRQQRFGGYTRSLMKGLGIPIENRWGLRPAVEEGTNRIAPLTVNRELDTKGWLHGVRNFNFHQHLPHYAVTGDDPKAAHVLATQPIDMTHPHPFTNAGNREFNALVWLPPSGRRAGDVLIADSTIFSTLFGKDDSLIQFWKNMAGARQLAGVR